MALKELILIFVLQFEAGVSGRLIFLYYRPGHDAILPCANESSFDTTCSIVTWFYERDPNKVFTEVENGNVRRSSVRTTRLRLDTKCSLVINNITAEDVGRYICRKGRDANQDVILYLSVLTISPSRPDADPKRDGEVMLECSLFIHKDLSPCRQNSIRWVDETGTVLIGEGVGYEFLGQTDCVSVLTVKRQSGNNRRYTCQLVDKKHNVEIEADYTPIFTDHILNQTSSSVIIGAVVGVVLLLVAIAAVLIKYRKRAKVTEDVQKPTQHPEEPESNLTYVTVSHANQQASPRKKIKEEEAVTYSTVKTSVKTEAGNDPSSVYSYVSKPE